MLPSWTHEGITSASRTNLASIFIKSTYFTTVPGPVNARQDVRQIASARMRCFRRGEVQLLGMVALKLSNASTSVATTKAWFGPTRADCRLV